MNNKRLISLTVCLILATVPGISPLILADIASETDTKAEQYFEKANELRKLADYDAAITEYKKVISLSTNSKIAQDAQYWIGQSYFGAGQFDAALSAFQKLLDEYPASTIIPSTKLMMERVQQAKKNKSLFEAAKKGDIEQVKLLISKGADVNAKAKDDRDFTPMYYAVQNGHKGIMEVLLANGADINAGDKFGYTPLYPAIWSNDIDTIRFMIEKGADVNLVAEGDYPPLYYGVMNNNLDSVKLLIANGAKFDVKTLDGWTVFYHAASMGHREIVEFFVSKGADVSTFHLAACIGDLGRVNSFVEQGTNVDTKDEHGWTPLHLSLIHISEPTRPY